VSVCWALAISLGNFRRIKSLPKLPFADDDMKKILYRQRLHVPALFSEPELFS
jgi:hypothetical protein